MIGILFCPVVYFNPIKKLFIATPAMNGLVTIELNHAGTIGKLDDCLSREQ